MTQTQQHAEEISGKKFVVFKLSPLVSQDLLIDLLNAVAPAAGSIAAGIGDAKGKDGEDVPITEREINNEAIAGGVASLVGALDKTTMRNMVETLQAVTTVDGVELSKKFELVFTDDIADMYKWLYFALTVQYSGFFAWLTSEGGGALGNLARAAMSQSDSGESGS